MAKNTNFKIKQQFTSTGIFLLFKMVVFHPPRFLCNQLLPNMNGFKIRQGAPVLYSQASARISSYREYSPSRIETFVLTRNLMRLFHQGGIIPPPEEKRRLNLSKWVKDRHTGPNCNFVHYEQSAHSCQSIYLTYPAFALVASKLLN